MCSIFRMPKTKSLNRITQYLICAHTVNANSRAPVSSSCKTAEHVTILTRDNFQYKPLLPLTLPIPIPIPSPLNRIKLYLIWAHTVSANSRTPVSTCCKTAERVVIYWHETTFNINPFFSIPLNPVTIKPYQRVPDMFTHGKSQLSCSRQPQLKNSWNVDILTRVSFSYTHFSFN